MKKARKLVLGRETLRRLEDRELDNDAGWFRLGHLYLKLHVHRHDVS
jgi:hypothetical protein